MSGRITPTFGFFAAVAVAVAVPLLPLLELLLLSLPQPAATKAAAANVTAKSPWARFIAPPPGVVFVKTLTKIAVRKP